jgi:imidazolonepropionase-like amidohydrolase
MAQSTATKVIKGARLVDVEAGRVIDNGIVVVDGDRITAAGGSDVRQPEGAEVIDAEGCTLLPGMIDCHLHTAMFNCMTFHNFRVAQWEVRPELQQMYSLFHAQMCFDMGFTTLRDLGLATSRGPAHRGTVRGPRFHRCRAVPWSAHAGGGLVAHHRLAP